MAHKTHASESKKKVVKELLKLIEEYNVVGTVDVEGLPAPQFQKMRASLKDSVKIVMTKKRLIKLALEGMKDKKKGIDALKDKLSGMPAMIFTKENPFKLFKVLDKNKSSAPAKAGQKAPKDIVVQAGPTSFAPGPIIGQLGQFGIKAGIDGGKIVIKENSVAVKEGEEIGGELAGILTRLGIEPMEIGLNLRAVYENGELYDQKVLAIDEDEYIGNITNGARWALNLSVFAGYPTKDNINTLISKAFTQTRNLAVDAAVTADDVVDILLAKAEREMLALKAQAGV